MYIKKDVKHHYVQRQQIQNKDYCFFCFIHLFPNEPIVRNYKTKEKTVVDYIKKNFPNYTWKYDKIIDDGCSKRRPDLLVDFGDQIIIIEVDENQHEYYDCSCENKRLMQISQDLGHRSIIFIRFNPDDYICNNLTIKSCWTINKLGICQIPKINMNEWNKRLNVLKSSIEYWIKNKTEKNYRNNSFIF